MPKKHNPLTKLLHPNKTKAEKFNDDAALAQQQTNARQAEQEKELALKKANEAEAKKQEAEARALQAIQISESVTAENSNLKTKNENLTQANGNLNQELKQKDEEISTIKSDLTDMPKLASSLADTLVKQKFGLLAFPDNQDLKDNYPMNDVQARQIDFMMDLSDQQKQAVNRLVISPLYRPILYQMFISNLSRWNSYLETQNLHETHKQLTAILGKLHKLDLISQDSSIFEAANLLLSSLDRKSDRHSPTLFKEHSKQTAETGLVTVNLDSDYVHVKSPTKS